MDPANYDTAELKLQTLMSKKTKPIHYIFALDESGSMSGSRWDELMKAMRINIQQIVNVNRD
jgi:secreted protein with Ig-like and vWFA domain